MRLSPRSANVRAAAFGVVLAASACASGAIERARKLPDYRAGLKECLARAEQLDAGADASLTFYENCARRVDQSFGVRDAGTP